MDFSTTIDLIIKDLREAREIIDDLKKYPGVPQIQIELAKSKCRSAEELMAFLKTLNNEYQPSYEQKADDVKVTKPSETTDQDSLIEITDEEVSESLSFSNDNEKAPEITSETIIKQTVTQTDTVIRKKSSEKLSETNIVADRFSGMSNIFHEQLGNIKSDSDISAVIKSRPVSNLTEAIGINDKFFFIREIFNGDPVSYNEAIAKLNKVDNLTDAKAVIMSYTGEGEESEAVKQLIDLVKRKLPADE